MLVQRNLIVINFEAVDWINSTGLGILIASYNLLREVGGKLVLTGSEPHGAAGDDDEQAEPGVRNPAQYGRRGAASWRKRRRPVALQEG